MSPDGYMWCLSYNHACVCVCVCVCVCAHSNPMSRSFLGCCECDLTRTETLSRFGKDLVFLWPATSSSPGLRDRTLFFAHIS